MSNLYFSNLFYQLDDNEYSIPTVEQLPTLESVLNDLDGEFDGFIDRGSVAPTPTPSVDGENLKQTSILRHVVLQGVTSQIRSASVRKFTIC